MLRRPSPSSSPTKTLYSSSSYPAAFPTATSHSKRLTPSSSPKSLILSSSSASSFPAVVFPAATSKKTPAPSSSLGNKSHGEGEHELHQSILPANPKAIQPV